MYSLKNSKKHYKCKNIENKSDIIKYSQEHNAKFVTVNLNSIISLLHTVCCMIVNFTIVLVMNQYKYKSQMDQCKFLSFVSSDFHGQL